ncbi:hypothetical protein M1145_00215 [Patescibacteria group bacterium]|nr:hypothetical protein [Patescibacteria group bacterium]
MDTDSSQIKVTIPKVTKGLLTEKAQSMGLSLTNYVKNLLYTDIKESTYPEYVASKMVDKSVKEAIFLSENGELKSFSTIDELDKLVDSVDAN